MELAAEALGNLLPKLATLLSGEYQLQKGVRGEIRFLQAEMERMQTALEAVSKLPASQKDKLAKIWVRDLKELCYDIEDSVDTFMVRLDDASSTTKPHSFRRFFDKTIGLVTKAKLHDIADDIQEIKRRIHDHADRRARYKLPDLAAQPDNSAIDPRLLALYEDEAKLIGIDGPVQELIDWLTQREGEEVQKQELMVVSIVGMGGLGKTTLANSVYQKLKGNFECHGFVPISQRPDLTKILSSIVRNVSDKGDGNMERWSQTDLINRIRETLEKKRYLIVIDDIWDISIWEIIKCALPDNEGSRIIATMRNINVGRQVGDHVYMLKPLSLQHSRSLFYRRIFRHEDMDKCLDEELIEVSNKILEKCAGVPLAVTTVASMLASKGRNKMEWYDVYNSLGAGLKNIDVENIRGIVLLSYFNLPFHLRICLLYLGVFPECHNIEKDRVIRLWIAEGFIRCREQGDNLFQVGESYFNELIKRSLVEPVYGWNFALTDYFKVHDVAFDVIRSLSTEENFATVLNDNVNHTSPPVKIRRLSLQNSKANEPSLGATMSMQQVKSVVKADATTVGDTMSMQPIRSVVQADDTTLADTMGRQPLRSVVVFRSSIDPVMLALQRFRLLRVLDLEGCHLPQGCSIKYLDNLLHLRYLGLRDTCIAELPEEIGNLQFLQTLDVRDNRISSLPPTVIQLKHLMCLLIGSWTRAPDGIGCLSSLQELSTLCISDDSTNTTEELGQLTELRVLSIDCRTQWNDGLDKSLVECLHKLQKIHTLSISVFGECNLNAWAAPQRLRRLELTGCWSSVLSSWLDPSLLVDLSFLSIEVMKLEQGDLEILGRLPSLSYLDLEVNHNNLGDHGRFIVGAGSFRCLVQCILRGPVGPVEFQQEAMPGLRSLCLTFHMLKMREIVNCKGYFDLGLGNLSSLKNVTVAFLSGGTNEEVEEAEAELRKAIEMHPNRPNLKIY